MKKLILGGLAIIFLIALVQLIGEGKIGEPAAEPAPKIALTTEQRLDKCTNRMVYYQDLGVWKAGGVKPIVAQGAWDELSGDEQAEIFQIAGCIDTAGEPREVMATVLQDGDLREIDTRRVTVE